jgi:peptide deformylase
MKLKIIQYPNPMLAEKSKKISIIDDSIRNLAADMAETMKTYGSEEEAGVAIAAVQVGVPIRMTVVREDDEPNGYFVLINPEVVKGSKKELTDIEGCMSVPLKYGKVARAEKLKVKGLDLDGRRIEVKAEGLMARILLHEIDHMNGLLFLNHVEPGELYRLNEEGKLVK